MSLENRAAQFAPFAALSGHDDAIAETARLTTPKLELSIAELNSLSHKLALAIEKRAEIKITYFQPDGTKQGGCYKTVCGKVKKVDEIEGMIVFADRRTVSLNNVTEIEGDIFNEMDF